MSTLEAAATAREPLRGDHGDSGAPLANRKSLRGQSPSRLLARLEALSIPVPWSGCHLWLGALDGRGRPKIHVDGKTTIAARVALESRLGRRLRRTVLACHTCDVKLCVNPEHLFPGTHGANMRDMARKNRASRKPSGGRRMTWAQVDDMRHRYELHRRGEAGGASTRELAAEFGLSRQAVEKILNGTRWRPQAQAAE